MNLDDFGAEIGADWLPIEIRDGVAGRPLLSPKGLKENQRKQSRWVAAYGAKKNSDDGEIPWLKPIY